MIDRPGRSNLIETSYDEAEEPLLPEEAYLEAPREADSVAAPAPVIEKNAETGVKNSLSPVRPIVWAVGGGKGGVGKSLISANFSLMLARRGRRVVAVDLDLGGSNLHTCLGVEPPASGLGDWVSGRNNDLQSLLVPVGEPGLYMLSGSQDPLSIVELIKNRRADLLKVLRAMDVDDIILDLGAGTHDMTISFFNEADRGIISVLPEPTSVENAYRFVRAVLFQRFLRLEMPDGIREVVETSQDPKNMLGIKTPGDLLAVVERLDGITGDKLRELLLSLDISVVINQVRNPVDVDVGRAICSVCRRYFGTHMKYAGYLDYDNAVWKSVRSRKAVVREFPHSVLTNRIEKLTRTLLGEERGLFP